MISSQRDQRDVGGVPSGAPVSAAAAPIRARGCWRRTEAALHRGVRRATAGSRPPHTAAPRRAKAGCDAWAGVLSSRPDKHAPTEIYSGGAGGRGTPGIGSGATASACPPNSRPDRAPGTPRLLRGTDPSRHPVPIMNRYAPAAGGSIPSAPTNIYAAQRLKVREGRLTGANPRCAQSVPAMLAHPNRLSGGAVGVARRPHSRG